MTMTPSANTPITAEGIHKAYAMQRVDARLRLLLEAQRAILHAWDIYEGGFNEAREGAKKAIEEQLFKYVSDY